MSTPTNTERGESAEKALEVFVGTQYFGSSTALEELATDRETYVGDLIANLLHYCDTHSIDFQKARERGETHYSCEISGDDG